MSLEGTMVESVHYASAVWKPLSMLYELWWYYMLLCLLLHSTKSVSVWKFNITYGSILINVPNINLKSIFWTFGNYLLRRSLYGEAPRACQPANYSLPLFIQIMKLFKMALNLCFLSQNLRVCFSFFFFPKYIPVFFSITSLHWGMRNEEC